MLDIALNGRILVFVAQKEPNKPATKTWQPTIEDQKLMDNLERKFGVGHPGILRIALRRLAEAEGLRGNDTKAAD